MENIKEYIINLFFPRRCPVCGDIVQPFGELICPGCVGKLSPVGQPVCKKCGKEVESRQMEYCRDCARTPKAFEQNFALLNYNSAASRSMSAIKYKGHDHTTLSLISKVLSSRFAVPINHMFVGILMVCPSVSP